MADPIQRQNFQNPPVHPGTTSPNQGGDLGRNLAKGVGFAAQLASAATAGTPYGAIPGAVSTLVSGGNSNLGGISGNIQNNQQQFMDLLNLQNQMQVQNQVFSTMSNVSKTEHDTRMAAVRNMRA